MSDAATMSLLRPRPSGLLPFVLGSVVAHVLVVFVGLTVTWALSGPKVNLEPVPIKASLVRRGKPRDEKLLPTKPAEPVAEKPPAEAIKLPSKDAVKMPAKDLKADQANKPTKADPRKSLFDAINKTARPVRELEGEEDGDPDGNSDKQEGERYFGLLESVIRKNYDVSSTIPESERRALRAQVTLWLGPAGQVLEVTVTRPSGNDQFDSAVLLAIKKASPFTPPPQHLRDILKKDGVGFVFRP